MRAFAILLRFVVIMCIMVVAGPLIDIASKMGNPTFYATVMFPCYSIVAFFALQGVFRLTQDMVENSERSEKPCDPEFYHPTKYESRINGVVYHCNSSPSGWYLMRNMVDEPDDMYILTDVAWEPVELPSSREGKTKYFKSVEEAEAYIAIKSLC